MVLRWGEKGTIGRREDGGEVMRTSWRPLVLAALFWKRGVVAFFFLSTSVMCVWLIAFFPPYLVLPRRRTAGMRTERTF